MKPAVTSFSYFTSHKMSLVRPGSHPTGRVIQAGGGATEALYSENTQNLIFKKSSTKFCHITFTRFSSMKQLFNMHQVNSSKTVFCRKKPSFGISSLTGDKRVWAMAGHWTLWAGQLLSRKKDSNFSQTTELWATVKLWGMESKSLSHGD